MKQTLRLASEASSSTPDHSERPALLEVKMFQRQIVFVVGAGCSAEYGFDVGSTLLNRISGKMLAPDETIFHALLRIPGGDIETERRLRNFSAGLQSHETIDQYLNFIRNDQTNVDLGKVGIARCILEQESASGLSDENLRQGIGGHSGTWLPKLISRILRDLGRENIRDAFRNITFICFNYDRVIEQIAFHQIYNATQDDAETADTLSGLKVIHPYGSLGLLPWQSTGDAVEFGRGADDHYLVRRASRSLSTFTETVRSEVATEIQTAINEADQICFNGFGYIKQNMELLHRDNSTPPRRVLMNTYKMPDPERTLAIEAVRNALYRSRPIENEPIDSGREAGKFINDWAGTLFT